MRSVLSRGLFFWRARVDVANAGVFAASDWAATMTATETNLTGGAVVD